MRSRMIIRLALILGAFLALAFNAQAQADPKTDREHTVVQLTKEATIDLWAEHLQVPLADLKFQGPHDKVCGGPMATTGGEYCPAGQEISISEAAFNWRSAGPLGMAYFLGHEFGHHLQYLANPGSRMNVSLEQQANCASGAMIQWLMQAHPEDGITEGMVQYLELAMLHGDEDAKHGSAAGMENAFDIGYHGGLAACVSIAGPLPSV